MQMQTNMSKTSKKPVKKFKAGDTVVWKSQAGGKVTLKQGTIIGVIPPNAGYGAAPYEYVPKKMYIDILRNEGEMTRDAAREELNKPHYSNYLPRVLEKRYKFKFGYAEGMNRNEHHYLVAVDRGEGLKPYLYHPKTGVLSLAD